MQVESSGAASASRFINEIGLRPGAPDEGQLITFLDNIAGKGGQTEYLHLALNRGLVVLKQKIADLEAQGKNNDSILASFALENPLLYRVAFLYFAALENMQSDVHSPEIVIENAQERSFQNEPEKLAITPEVKSVVAPSLLVSDGEKDIDDTKNSGVINVKKPDWSNLKGLASGKAGGE